VLADGWVVPGVLAEVDAGVEPELREPEKFGDFAWIAAAQLPDDAFLATRLLLEALS
jgi:hypothetical protein